MINKSNKGWEEEQERKDENHRNAHETSGVLLFMLWWFLRAAAASALRLVVFPLFFWALFPLHRLSLLRILLDHIHAGWSGSGTASLLQIIIIRHLCVEVPRLKSWSTVGFQLRWVHFRREGCMSPSFMFYNWKEMQGMFRPWRILCVFSVMTMACAPWE